LFARFGLFPARKFPAVAMWVPKPTSPFESDVSKETKLVAKKSGETWKVRGDAIAIMNYDIFKMC